MPKSSQPGQEPASVPGVVFAATDPVARADLSAALSAEGYGVWPVQSGLEAMSTFLDHTGEVDVFLLDAGLADVRGGVFARRLQAHFPGVPCVFVTIPKNGEHSPPRSAVLRAVRRAIALEVGESVGLPLASDVA